MARRRTRTRKRQSRGGMFRSTVRPVRQLAVAVGENVGKEYLQKKLPKVIQGIHDDPSLAKSHTFVLSATKPMPTPIRKMSSLYNLHEANKENMMPFNRGGRRRRRRTKRRGR